MTVYYLITFFLLGTIFGSFYNVVGDRLPNGESIVTPRSHCPHCNHYLTPIELIPIFSYLIQGGKCKKCKKKIPVFHPLFEFCSGVLFAFSYYIFRFTPELVIALTFVSMLLIIFVSDVKTMIIPDEVLIVFGLLLIFEIFSFNGFQYLLKSLANGVISMLIMYGIKLFGDFLFKKESMGGGDIKLLFLFGVVLGWQLAIMSVFVGSFIGLPVAIFILHLKKNHEIPFGPFLSLGAIILLFLDTDFMTIINLLG